MGRPLFFEELLTTLRSASTTTSRDFEQNLYYELEQARPKFFQLFDIPPRNPQERQEIEAGVAKLHGKSDVSHFNNQFKQETLFLAQELDCSEIYCAELIDSVAVMDKIGRRATAEDAVVRLHEERACMLACLRHIFETAMNPEGLSEKLAAMLRKYAIELVTSSVELGGGKGKGRLADKVLLEVDRLKATLEKTRVSLLNAPTTTNATSFGDAILKFKLERVQQERRQLGHLIFVFSVSRQLERTVIIKMVRWLASAERTDDLIYYILTSVLTAIDPSPDTDDPDATNSLLNDRELMVQMNSALEQTAWKVPGLKACVNLQWSLWVLEVRRQDPHIQGNLRGIEEDVEKIVESGINGDAFKFLTDLVLHSRRPAGDDEDLVGDVPFSDEATGSDSMEPVFRPYFLTQLDTLIESLIVNMSSILKRIRTREDDAEYAHSRSLRLSTTPIIEAPRRNDTESLFRLIAVIFAERELDAGIKYWKDTDDYDGRLFAFLQWATEAKRPELTVALYEMLASLARGSRCAAEAFNFLATNGGQYRSSQAQVQGSCSWSTLFNALHSTSEHLTRSRAPQMQSSASFGRRPASSVAPSGTLSPEEVRLLRSFLRLLRNVVRHSIPAKEVIRDQQDFNALQTLFNIVSFSVPLELKAALYETLAAFCGTGGSVKDAETIRTMWNMLDRAEVLRPAGPSGLVGGAVLELEQVETPAKTYPTTISLVELLNALIYVPTRRDPDDYIPDLDVQTIPDNLGAQKRNPGLYPYIDFVANDVILKAGMRGFNSLTERFKLLDGSFHFLEKCLASYELSSLRTLDLSAVASGRSATGLTTLVIHPGFDIMCRVLASDSPLRKELFTYISQGYEAIEKDFAKTHYFSQAVRRVLQIVHHIFRIQEQFLQFLLPVLSQNPNVPGLGPINLPRGIAALEQYLLWSPELVPQIGMYVNRVEDPEMMLLAVKILSRISESSIFNIVDSTLPSGTRRMNRLVVLLDRHSDTPQIVEGFVRLLTTEIDEVDESGASPDDPQVVLAQRRRTAIMDLLLTNTIPGKQAPNVAHLLLGFPLGLPVSEMTIPDPEAVGANVSCLHTIINLVNTGVPRLRSPESRQGEEQASTVAPLFERDPVFAEQCYRLLYQLCMHEFTCTPTVRYLRTREDFFARHLAVLPTKVPPIPPPKKGTGGQVLYGDQLRLQTTCKALTAYLRLRTSLLECVALELHVLNETKQPQRMARLLELLFDLGSRSSTSNAFQPMSQWDTALMNGTLVAQPLIRILEIFDSLDFDWLDDAHPQDQALRYFQGENFDNCLQWEDGCQVYSRSLVSAVIQRVRKQMRRQGMTDAVEADLTREIKFVVDSCSVENHRRLVQHAKEVSFVAWRHVLDISLLECFDRLPRGRREHLTLDILQALSSFLSRSSPSPAIVVLLAEVVLSLSTKLREDRHHQLIIQSTVDDSYAASLPLDRIHSIFRGILQCILQSGTSERFRGNLYAALTNIIHLVMSDSAQEHSPKVDGTGHKLSERSLSFIADEPSRDADSLLFGRSVSSRGSQVKRTALESGTLNIVNKFVDRIVPVVCRDAADGSEVWKTVAFTFLDALVQLSRVEKEHHVLRVMAREGFLKNFVHSLKSADADMMAVLKPDPDNLNPLYVYEAKMALLIRVAQTRQGANKLADCRIFGLLTHCDFLDARPQNDHAFLDFDSFLPSAVERYHQIIIPTLELTVSILSAVGPLSVVSKQALDFLMAHRSTILVLLSDRWDELTLSMLRELQLLVALSSLVLPSVEDLLSPTGFGAIHTAVLSLSARCMGPLRWREAIVPASEVEVQETQTPVKGYGKDARDNVFSEKANTAVFALQKWLAIYSLNVTESKGDFKPVISSAITFSANGELSSQIRSSCPTIADAITALGTVIAQFMEAKNDVEQLVSSLVDPDRISVDEVSEIVKAAYADIVDELDMNQRRVLAIRELERSWEKRQREYQDLLHWLEVLLLLIWRHVDFFLSKDVRLLPSRGVQQLEQSRTALNLRSSVTYSGTGAPHAVKEHVARELLPVLDQLDVIELVEDELGKCPIPSNERIRKRRNSMKYSLPLAALAIGTSAQQQGWGQCGGNGWTGPTTCLAGWVCTYNNAWYSQCLPAPITSARPTSTVRTTSPPAPPPTSRTTSSSTPVSSSTGSGKEIPLGTVITGCTVNNTVAITFDDGPYQWTSQLIDSLNTAGVKATFFMCGHLYACIYDYADVVKKAFNSGHQIASHTWDHPHLPQLSTVQVQQEMQKNEVAFQKILGIKPKWVRPPYGETNAQVVSTLAGMGYKIVTWNLDSEDWNDKKGNDSLKGATCPLGLSVSASEAKFNALGPNPKVIPLEHDALQTTAQQLGPWIAQWAKSRGLNPVPVSECLGEPQPGGQYTVVGGASTKDSTWVC
ncbi:hypothetical protein FRB99_000102 [Tulasnella sp. 403]|nr:hypothetical protein FRB99_000102 [Tulasnella sp. 403]